MPKGSKTIALRILLLAIVGLTPIALVFSLAWPAKPAVIESGAQAWVSVGSARQSQLVDDLRDYSEKNSLRFSANVVPAPWKMIGMTMLTPAGNQISFINATAREKFSVSMTVFQKHEDWTPYWARFRAYVRARYEWKDVR
jgi:hypothetical protein